jgi:LacI family transcriptional regulator
MATIRDVAKLAGVSVSAVSAVTNRRAGVSTSLAERVWKAIDTLDYHPDSVARSLRVRRTKTLGVVMPQIASPFYAEVLRGVEEEAKGNDYSILICDSAADPDLEQRLLKSIVARRVDGILLASADPHFSDQQLVRRKLPVVYFDRLPPSCRGPAVMVNNLEGAFEATRHLIELGHRRIAIITGPVAVSTAAERVEGFRNAMGMAGLPIPEGHLQSGEFRLEGGYRCALEMMGLSPRPTALFATNYEMTLGALRALRELGIRCPQDVSVMGFDDFVMGADGYSWAAMFSPQLTTVAQPSYEIGREAVRLLLSWIEKPEDEHQHGEDYVVRLCVELRVRESTAPPASTRTMLSSTLERQI